jgi:hypothetical protein
LENCKKAPFFGWKIVKIRRFLVGKLQKNAIFRLENCKKAPFFSWKIVKKF